MNGKISIFQIRGAKFFFKKLNLKFWYYSHCQRGRWRWWWGWRWSQPPSRWCTQCRDRTPWSCWFYKNKMKCKSIKIQTQKKKFYLCHWKSAERWLHSTWNVKVCWSGLHSLWHLLCQAICFIEKKKLKLTWMWVLSPVGLVLHSNCLRQTNTVYFQKCIFIEKCLPSVFTKLFLHRESIQFCYIFQVTIHREVEDIIFCLRLRLKKSRKKYISFYCF